MMTPDRRIVKKIQNYDKELFVKWNNRKQFFEVWRHKAVGSILITPITQSIYIPDAPIEYCPLDERVLWWLYESDSWNKPKNHWLEQDKRFMEFGKYAGKKRRQMFRDYAKDVWQQANSRFMTNYTSKNKKHPNLEGKHFKPAKFIRPDLQSKTASRVWARSKTNAKAYNYQGTPQ